MRSYESLIEESDEFKFDEYYQLNHLPVSSRIRLENSNNEYSDTELHTGIPSIEEAIRLYVNKYARTMKVRDLVESFNQRLKSLKAVAEYEKNLRDNIAERERLLNEVEKIEEQIHSGKSASKYVERINKINPIATIKREVSKFDSFLNRIDRLLISYRNDTKVLKSKAEKIVEGWESQREDMIEQLDSRLTTIYDNCFRLTYDMIISDYREQLSKFGFKTSDEEFEFNPIDFIGQELLDLDDIILNATSQEDEGYTRTWKVKKKVPVKRSKWNPLYWLWDEWTTEEKEVTESEWVSNYVDYVDMSEVVHDYFGPLYNEIVDVKESIVAHIEDDIKDLKEKLKEQIQKVENILAQKLKEVRERANQADRTKQQIEQQEYELKWMNDIIDRVNNLINY